MSCSSKRSLIPTMSRSSTITESNQEICFGASSYKSSLSIENHHQRLTNKPLPPFDRISMRSQESCGNFSEYSIPRQFQFHSHEASSIKSYPRHDTSTSKSFVGSYDNYDSPKILSPTNENQMENYDKPKSIKMYLEQNAGGRHKIFNGDHGNYDKPNMHAHHCTNGQSSRLNEDIKADCTCHRVMSWADNWMPCRRGSGIENTGIPLSRLVPSTPTPTGGQQTVIAQEPIAKCKLTDFSNGQFDKSGLYALVDPAKKQPKRLNDEQSQPILIPRAQSQTPSANYANLDFEKSLEIYENAREVLKRANVAVDVKENKENENYLVMDVHEKSKSFPGYISMQPKTQKVEQAVELPPLPPLPQGAEHDDDEEEDEEVEVEVEKKMPQQKRPINKLTKINLDEKSHSNPDLNRPSLCTDEEHNASSTATKLVFKKSSSVDSLRYIENESPTIIEDEPASTASSSTYQEITTKVDSIIDNKPREHIKVTSVRHAECPKIPNRDSSSSNDSGVSTSTIMPKHFNEFELPLINQIKKRRQLNQTKSCVHASLIRRSKSFDPFGDLSFQFATRRQLIGNGGQAKSGKCPSLNAIMTSHIDSNSTSSGTSDMSDYIETLSLSSSSSE
jgi:hypothetical protein